MICIYINRCQDGRIRQFKVLGHSDYAEEGKDIVCAAVSTAIIVTVNAINLVGFIDYIEYVIEEGYFKLEVSKENEILDQLLINLDYTLHDLEKQYPKYIKYQKEE